MLYTLLVLLLILVITVCWLVSRKLNSYKNEPMIFLDLDLENKKIEEQMRIIEKQVALRHALNKGVNPNSCTIEQLITQYKEDLGEEGVLAAMKELNLSREEAIAQGFNEGGVTFVRIEARRREASKKLGRDIPWKEFIDTERGSLRNSKYPGPDCWELWEIERYLKGDNFLIDRVSHLESCPACHSLVITMTPDPEMQKPSGPNCITENELLTLKNMGLLSKARRSHTLVCKKCRSKVHSAQEWFIEKGAPLHSWD